jgi:hypothetical protein
MTIVKLSMHIKYTSWFSFEPSDFQEALSFSLLFVIIVSLNF